MAGVTKSRAGNGARLRAYWTRGEGLAKWGASPHPWSTLYGHLVKHVGSPDLAARLTETYYRAVFHKKSGWRRGKDPLGPG